MLGQRRRRWTGIKTTLAQHLVVAGKIRLILLVLKTTSWLAPMIATLKVLMMVSRPITCCYLPTHLFMFFLANQDFSALFCSVRRWLTDIKTTLAQHIVVAGQIRLISLVLKTAIPQTTFCTYLIWTLCIDKLQNEA